MLTWLRISSTKDQIYYSKLLEITRNERERWDGTHTDMPSAIGACKVSFFLVWRTREKNEAVKKNLRNGGVITAFLENVWYVIVYIYIYEFIID